ncbi:ead/Ea22-like family protein [Escherichia coli]|uniref:ead/Ea22-like family protein n=1 Tax=Escherichia coli TaxID=562 RepID=UPI003551DA1F|nr:ead/Ea22-like family protein [Escherichia coli]
MSKIDYQALREAAEKAMWGDWDSYKPHRGARGYEVRLSSQAIAQHVLKNNAEFIASFNPKIALALLDERERNQQYIKRRDQENEDIALTVGKLRVELEAAENNLIDSECHVAELEEALRDKQALLEASEKRIAELEAELVSQTYKLNELSGNYPVTPDGWISCSERMPNDKQFVWCWGKSYGWTECDTFEGCYDCSRNKWWAVTDNWEEPASKVTHWMPLPEPPQEVNRG